jgi:hypothetical protein
MGFLSSGWFWLVFSFLILLGSFAERRMGYTKAFLEGVALSFAMLLLAGYFFHH